jgi:hypothetical protein
MTTTPDTGTTPERAAAEAAVRRAHASGEPLDCPESGPLQPFYGDYSEHDPDAAPKREIPGAEAFDCWAGRRECARCRWLRAHLGLPQHRTFTEETP